MMRIELRVEDVQPGDTIPDYWVATGRPFVSQRDGWMRGQIEIPVLMGEKPNSVLFSPGRRITVERRAKSCPGPVDLVGIAPTSSAEPTTGAGA